MSKLPEIFPTDLMFPISVCSLNSSLELNPLRVTSTQEKINKITRVLENSRDSKIILFPEYTYSENLNELFQNYSNAHNIIIIGGSGLEPTEDGKFYAFSPVFIPNENIFKVYKKNIIQVERGLSAGALIPYPHEIKRTMNFLEDENGRKYSFSVFICSDFLIENRDQRADIFFVPQYENSPGQFLTQGHTYSSGHKNFIIGANNADHEQRSLGFAILNNSTIDVLAQRNFRRGAYNDENGSPQTYNPSLAYDMTGEKLLKIDLNIGRPYSLSYDFHFTPINPVLIPKELISL